MANTERTRQAEIMAFARDEWNDAHYAGEMSEENDECPHPKGSILAQAWETGHNDSFGHPRGVHIPGAHSAGCLCHDCYFPRT